MPTIPGHPISLPVYNSTGEMDIKYNTKVGQIVKLLWTQDDYDPTYNISLFCDLQYWRNETCARRNNTDVCTCIQTRITLHVTHIFVRGHTIIKTIKLISKYIIRRRTSTQLYFYLFKHTVTIQIRHPCNISICLDLYEEQFFTNLIYCYHCVIICICNFENVMPTFFI